MPRPTLQDDTDIIFICTAELCCRTASRVVVDQQFDKTPAFSRSLLCALALCVRPSNHMYHGLRVLPLSREVAETLTSTGALRTPARLHIIGHNYGPVNVNYSNDSSIRETSSFASRLPDHKPT